MPGVRLDQRIEGVAGLGETGDVAVRRSRSPTIVLKACSADPSAPIHDIPPLLAATLPALRADPAFRRTATQLRRAGWRDWHLLVAVHNVAVNERLDPELVSHAGDRPDALRAGFRRPEDPGSPVPVDAFTSDRLKTALEVSLTSTLMNHWNLVVRQRRIDVVAVRTLLGTRFGYGSSDTPHEDPFTKTVPP